MARFLAPSDMENKAIRLGRFLGRVKNGVLETTCDYDEDKHKRALLEKGFTEESDPVKPGGSDAAEPTQSEDDDTRAGT